MKKKDTITFLMMNIRDLYPEEETRSIAFLVLDFMGFSKRELVLKGDEKFDLDLMPELNKIIGELKRGKPVQYILGQADFFGLKFCMNENVLIPRAETEEMADLIIKENSVDKPRIVDIGTGSGCIAICLGKFIKGSEVFATDILEPILKIAKYNAEKNKVSINFLKDDIFRTKLIRPDFFDIMVSNPPYVTESEKKRMHMNVVAYEPGYALFVPDNNPLKYYMKLAEVGFSILKNGASLYVEINEKFGKEVAGIFQNKGFSQIGIVRDINNKERIVKAIKILS